MSKSTEEADYLDRINGILPWHRSFTSNERIFIVLITSTFVSIIGCTLLCLICSYSRLRRPYYTKKTLDREQRILIATAPRAETLVYTPPPPRYDSIFKANELHNGRKNRYLDAARKSSFETTSDSDGIQSNGDVHPHPRNHSARSSQSNGDTVQQSTDDYLIVSYAQIHVELNIDITKNLLRVHLTNGQHIRLHPAFDEQAEFYIHIQFLNNKIFKKFHDGWKKRQSSLQLSTWKRLQEKSTKKLSRTPNDTLICDEYLQFEFNQDDLTTTSLRLLLFCIDHSGIQDLISESLISLNSSMVPNWQQVVQFKELPQISFGEIFLGISYLPTAERFTIRINKLRYFCKIENDQTIDARLIVTFFHQGRRFFQKKFSPIIFDQSKSITKNNNTYELKGIIIQNIPQNDIQSVYVHIELILHILHPKDESILSCGSILLGEHTRYKIDWQKLLDQPRQIHQGWYQFFG